MRNCWNLFDKLCKPLIKMSYAELLEFIQQFLIWKKKGKNIPLSNETK